MKFLVLMAEADHFDRWDASTDEAQQTVFDCMSAFVAAVSERGEVVGGEALARPAESRTLRGGAVTDGPYAETVEQIGGFFLVDLPDIETTLSLAKLLPSAYTIEVRPVIPT